MSEKSEKVKIVPNPEAEVEAEETESKSKFPMKLVRNVVIGAVGVAITGYVVSKLRNKDDEEESSESTAQWIGVIVPDSDQKASGE